MIGSFDNVIYKYGTVYAVCFKNIPCLLMGKTAAFYMI